MVTWKVHFNRKMMIRYKRTYAAICQYMPNKLQKRGFKVWYFANEASKFVWNFDNYCRKSNNGGVTPSNMVCGEQTLAHNVVLKLLKGLEKRGHVKVIDNFFSSVGFFKNLKTTRGIFAIGTMQSNCIGLPLDLKDTKRFSRV